MHGSRIAYPTGILCALLLVAIPARANEADAPLVVMTFNVGASMPGIHLDYPEYIRQLADYIATQRVDILGLQEIPLDRDGVNMAVALAESLAQRGHFMDMRWSDRGDVRVEDLLIGNAVFSVHPIHDWRTHVFDAIYGPRHHVIQIAEIALDATSAITVINHHPHPAAACSDAPEHPYFEQFMEVVTPHAQGKTIVLGDFNFTSDSRCYQAVSEHFTNACPPPNDPEVSCWITAPGHRIAIDYIFYHSQRLVPIQVFADQDNKMSDHYPVVAHFQLLNTVDIEEAR